MSLTLERLYHPDGKQLGSLVAGLSGSGKTTAVLSTLQQAIKSKSFGENHRFIIIDPKTQTGDYDILAEPVYTFDKTTKSILKNRVTVVFPDLDALEYEVTQIVDYIFMLSNTNPDTSFTLVLDEASTLITPTRIPNSLKRLAVQGRAKRVKPIFISQRPIVNRWTDANLSNLLLFNTLPVDFDTLSKRWGLDFTTHAQPLRTVPYSYLWFNLETAEVKPMQPVSLPISKPPAKAKRRWWTL